MKLCFYQRIAVIVVGVFMLILVLFFIASSHLQSHTRIEAEQKMQQNLASHLVNSNPLLRYGVTDLTALKSLFSSLMLLDPSVEFYYLDDTGSIIAHSAGSEIALRKSIDLTPILEFIDAPGNFPLRADDPKNSQIRKIFSASPIFKDDELQGYLYVILGSQQYDSILAELEESQALREFILFVSAGLAALLVVMLVLFKLITSPLRQLSQDMTAFRQADYKLSQAQLSHQTWCADSRSEIDKLGCAFNELFAHVDSQFHALERTNQQRKEMLADLSHDLRTPLASMNGYIETLQLQGDALSSEDKAKFMAICMRNMNNLKQLIDQIFELAYLEGGQVSLACEAIVVGEFLHDIATKFSMAAKDKNISINVEPKQFECFVNTDLGKLERVLSNLIDNAIRHTPENGSVTIRATAAEKYIVLSVEDTGIGIEAGELEDIFLPRYQASNSRKEAGHNVGLGLAISQKLVLLLGSTLQVSSRPGKGTCFSFNLEQT